MRRLSSVILGMFIGGALSFAAFKYHLVRTNEGFQVIPRRNVTVSDPYVDIRTYGASEWTNHRDLAADLMAANKGNLMGEGAGSSIQQGLEGMIEDMRR